MYLRGDSSELSATPLTTQSSASPTSVTSPSPAPPQSNNIAATRTPTNDDIEAIIQMATSNISRNTPDGRPAPLRDTRTQLFVGNLPYRVRWQDLKDLFRKAGTVLRADVSLGPDNRSRGFGTVLLATAEDAGRAVDMYNGYEWQTRVLEVRPDRSSGVGGGMLGGVVGLGSSNRDHLASTAPSFTPGAISDDGDYAAFQQLQSSALSPHHPFLYSPSQSQAASHQNLPTTHPHQHPSLHTRSISHSLLEQGLFDHQSVLEHLDQRPTTSGTIGIGVGGFNAVDLGGTNGVSVGFGGSGSGGGNPPNRTLFVGNLPFHVQWQDLKDLFRLSGPVLRADVALAVDGRSRGFGTVVFRTEEEAERARRYFDGYDYNGRTLKVHFDKFSQSQAQLGPPYELSLSGVGRGSSSLLSSTRLPDDLHSSSNNTDYDGSNDSGLYSPSKYQSLLNNRLSTPVSPMFSEQTHVSPIPVHAASFSASMLAAAAASGSSQSQPQQPFSPFTYSLPPSQPYSPVQQHSLSATASANPSSSSLAASQSHSPSLQPAHSYSQPLVPRTTHRNSRAGNGDTSLSLPESLVPSSYPSPSPNSGSALTTSSLTELLLQTSSSGMSTASILDRLPSSVSGMPTSGSSGNSASSASASMAGRVENALAMLKERDYRQAEHGYDSHRRTGYDRYPRRESTGFGQHEYRERTSSTSSSTWDREWDVRRTLSGGDKEGDWRADGAEGVNDNTRRARSTSRHDVSGRLDINHLVQSLEISQGEQSLDRDGGGMLDKGGTTSASMAGNRRAHEQGAGGQDREGSMQNATRRPPLAPITGATLGGEPSTPTSSWSPSSTAASRSASAATSSGGMSFTSSSVTSDQLSPKLIQAVPASELEQVNHPERGDGRVSIEDDVSKRRVNMESTLTLHKPEAPQPVHHPHSQPTTVQMPSVHQTTDPNPPSSTTKIQQQRRPGVRSPRHSRTAQSQPQQTHHQHPHHPGPIVLPPPVPVTTFMPHPHSMSPHGMIMGMGSPLHHPGGMSPVYHPGAHTTPTNATTAAMGVDHAATPGFSYGVHGLHPSIVPMTPHGLPPITPSMPPFTFLPQPSPLHHHPDAANSAMHYPPMMSMGMGGVTLASSPTQSSFTPTTLGPSSPHHHISQTYQHPPHHPVHHHMVTTFSPGVAMSPGSVYGRPGGPSNPFINPAVGAPVRMVHHPLHSPGYYPSAQSFSPGEVQLGQEPGGYFDTVYMYNGMGYGPIGGAGINEGGGGTTDVASEIMKTQQEGGSGDVVLGTQSSQDIVESPDEDDATGETKTSRTHSLSSKRPEGPFLMHRSDSDPSMKTPGGTVAEEPQVKES